MNQLLNSQYNDLTNHDLATLADWADNKAQLIPNEDWKLAFNKLKEGADLLLRRRARSTVEENNHIVAIPVEQDGAGEVA